MRRWRNRITADRKSDAAEGVRLRGQVTILRLGIAHFSDRFQDGTTGSSTVLEAGASRRLLDNRLELNASTSIALENTNSIDLPTRHRFGARYAVTNAIRLIGSYEIAEGEAIDARTVSANAGSVTCRGDTLTDIVVAGPTMPSSIQRRS